MKRSLMTWLVLLALIARGNAARAIRNNVRFAPAGNRCTLDCTWWFTNYWATAMAPSIGASR